MFFVLRCLPNQQLLGKRSLFPYIYRGDVVAENGARPDWFSIANPNVGAKPEDENMFRTRPCEQLSKSLLYANYIDWL